MTNFVGNQVVYGSIAAETYVPDQLVYDTRLMVTQVVTLAATAAVLKRGTVISLATLAPSVATTDTHLAILANDAPISGSTQQATVYVAGEFNANALSFDRVWAGLTTGVVISGEASGPAAVSQFGTGVTALAPVLATNSIYLKTATTAIGPNYPVN